MNFRGLTLLNIVVFTLFLVIFTSLQCSLWLQFFGFFPAPQTWIPFLVYWAIYRNFVEGLLFCYIITIATVPLTAMPLSIFTILCLVIFLFTKLIKERIYWNGVTYLMFICGIMSLSYPIFHIALSWLLEKNPISDPEIIDSILTSLLTSLIALPAFFIFSKLDQWTRKELPTDVGVIHYE